MNGRRPDPVDLDALRAALENLYAFDSTFRVTVVVDPDSEHVDRAFIVDGPVVRIDDGGDMTAPTQFALCLSRDEAIQLARMLRRATNADRHPRSRHD